MSGSKRKAAPAPDMGGLAEDWKQMTSLRQGERTQEEAQTPDPEPTKPVSEAAVDSGPSMTRRSWYASTDAVQELARVVDDIHYATRVPKHEVVSALFRAAVAAAPRVEKKLSKEK